MSEKRTRRSFLQKSAATTTLLGGGLLGATGSAAAATDYVVEGYNDSNEMGNYAIEVRPPSSIDGNTDGDVQFIDDTEKVIIAVDNVPANAYDEFWEIDGADSVTITEAYNVSLEKYTKS